jgi:mannosyltransferase OCH1-like enzyme
MKENDVMPGKGIPNRIMTFGPWEPEWFESYSQQFMPNNTEFKYYNYTEVSSEVHRISKEMEKVGIKGAENAYNLLRPYAFKKDLFQWMALWDNGGIFMDAKMGFNHSVSEWLDFNNDEFVTCGAPGMYTNNAIMAMTKHHPYGLIQAKNVIDKVNDRTYYVPYDANGGKQLSNLNITGPDSIRSLFI